MCNIKDTIDLCKLINENRNNKLTLKQLKSFNKDNVNSLNTPVKIPGISEAITPLSIAALRGNEVILDALLESGANPNVPHVYPPLHHLVNNNNTVCVKKLLTNTKVLTDVNIRDEKQCTALHIAAQKGFIDIVRLLLDANALIDARMQSGVTPLIAAVQRTHLQVVELLCQRGADVTLSAVMNDQTNSTALCLAAEFNLVKFIEILITAYKETPEPVLTDIKRSYLIAKVNNHPHAQRIIRAFLEMLANKKGFNVSQFFNGLDLVQAAINGDVITLKRLLAANPSFNVNQVCEYITLDTEKIEATLIYISVLNKQIEVVKFLVKHNADPTIACEHEGYMPLHVAARYPNVEMLKIILSSKKISENKSATVNLCNQDNATPLQIAVSAGLSENCKVLLDNDADPLLLIGKGNTSLHIAAQNNDVKTASEILASKAYKDNPNKYIDCLNDDGATPLYLAVTKGHTAMMKLLLEAGASPNSTVILKDKNLPVTMLEFVLRKENIMNILLLLKHGADPDKSMIEENPPLFVAIRSKNLTKVRAFFSSPIVKANIKEYVNKIINGNTPLHIAIAEGTQEIIEFLLELGADINLLTKVSTEIPVDSTLYKPYGIQIEIINSKKRIDGYYVRPIHVAASSPNTDFISLLHSRGANLNFQSGDTYSPLVVALKFQLFENFKRLLDLGAEPTCLVAENSTYHFIPPQPYAELIFSNPRFNKDKHRFHNGFTLLHSVCTGNNLWYVNRLLDLNFDPLQASDCGITPFSISILFGAMQTFKVLVNRLLEQEDKLRKALNTPLKLDCSPLQIIYLFNKKLTRFLINKGADPKVSCPDNPAQTIAEALNINEIMPQQAPETEFSSCFSSQYSSEISMSGRKFLLDKGYTPEEIQKMQKGYQDNDSVSHTDFWENTSTANPVNITWCDGKVSLLDCPSIQVISKSENCYYLLMAEDISSQGCPLEILNLFKQIMPIFNSHNIKKINLREVVQQFKIGNDLILSLQPTHEICTGATKHRVLVYELLGDDRRSTLYLAAKYLEHGLHDHKDIKSLESSSSVIELHFPLKMNSVVDEPDNDSSRYRLRPPVSQ